MGIEMAMLCALVIAFSSKNVIPDVAAALKGNTPPSHEARMERLRQQGKSPETSTSGQHYTPKEALRANVRNAGERAAMKRGAKHEAKLDYLRESWEDIKTAKREKLDKRARRKQSLVNRVAAARATARGWATAWRTEDRAWRENQHRPHPDMNDEDREWDPRSELDDMLRDVPDDPEHIWVDDPDYPGWRTTIGELQRRYAERERSRTVHEHHYHHGPDRSEQERRRDRAEREQLRHRLNELREELRKHQESSSTPPAADSASNENADDPIHAHSERVDEQPELEAGANDGSDAEEAELVDDTGEQPAVDEDPAEQSVEDATTSGSGGNGDVTDPSGDSLLATVTPISVKQEEGMTVVEGGIEGATGKLDELAAHFETSNGAVTSTREAFEAARWSGEPIEKLQAAIKEINKAITNLNAAAASIRTGGFATRDVLTANSQVGSDQSVRG